LRRVDASTAGLSGKLSSDEFRAILDSPWRAYIDFAVQPETSWHVGPDSAATYAPGPLEVDAVVLCAP